MKRGDLYWVMFSIASFSSLSCKIHREEPDIRQLSNHFPIFGHLKHDMKSHVTSSFVPNSLLSRAAE
jgi:hypothetical protein